GERVTTAAQWWSRRRPEIVEDFEREVYGRVSKNVPSVTWTLLKTGETMVGEIPAIEKQLRGQVDNSACPAIEVNISMTLVTPKNPDKPVPVLMMYGFAFGGFGPGAKRPGAPPAKEGTAPSATPKATPKAAPPRGFGAMGPPRTETLLKAGWGYA